MVQVIYIESFDKICSPYCDTYLSAPIDQRLARSLRMRKVTGSNPTFDKYVSFCNSRFAPLTGQVRPCT